MGCCGPKVSYGPWYVGDLRPIALIVNPYDTASVASATYSVIQLGAAAGTPPYATGSFLVDAENDGSHLTTNLIEWTTAGYFTVLIALTWNDGQVTNDLSAQITVCAQPS